MLSDRTSAHPHQSGTPTLHKLHMHHTVACDPSLAGAVSVPRYCRAWGHLAAAWYCAVCEWSLSSIGRAAALHKWGDALPRFGSERAFAGAQGVQGAAGEDAVFGACRRRQPHSDATGFATLCGLAVRSHARTSAPLGSFRGWASQCGQKQRTTAAWVWVWQASMVKRVLTAGKAHQVSALC